MAVQISLGERAMPLDRPCMAREMSTPTMTRPMSEMMARIF